MIHKDELIWSKEAQEIPLGAYRHYSGRYYHLVGVAWDSETLKEMVVYQAQYGEKNLWVRPLEMFLEEVEIDGVRQPRFKKID